VFVDDSVWLSDERRTGSGDCTLSRTDNWPALYEMMAIRQKVTTRAKSFQVGQLWCRR